MPLNQIELEIFNALVSRETVFTVNGIEFTENLIEGTPKERDRKAKKRAKQLAPLVA